MTPLLPTEAEVAKLAEALRRDFPALQPSRDRAWSRAPALRVIDCVLSLNRRYDAFLVPRLDRFERDHPSVTSLRELRALIDSFPSPAAFTETVLNYRDSARAATLSAVLDFAVAVCERHARDSELAALQRWATSARPGDYKTLKIRGFGIAGFQYLRMLFGANTTKPDVHIRKYVGQAIDRPVSDVEALQLLEAAAAKGQLSVRDFDTSIWERSARAGAAPRAV